MKIPSLNFVTEYNFRHKIVTESNFRHYFVTELNFRHKNPSQSSLKSITKIFVSPSHHNLLTDFFCHKSVTNLSQTNVHQFRSLFRHRYVTILRRKFRSKFSVTKIYFFCSDNQTYCFFLKQNLLGLICFKTVGETLLFSENLRQTRAYTRKTFKPFPCNFIIRIFQYNKHTTLNNHLINLFLKKDLCKTREIPISGIRAKL